MHGGVTGTAGDRLPMSIMRSAFGKPTAHFDGLRQLVHFVAVGQGDFKWLASQGCQGSKRKADDQDANDIRTPARILTTARPKGRDRRYADVGARQQNGGGR